MKSASDLLNLPEAASYLHVAVISVRRYIRAGRLRAVRVGPKLLFVRRSELEQFLSSAEKNAAPARA